MSGERNFPGPFSGVVTSRICPTCGHHEIGVQDAQGRFRPLRPGERVEVLGEAPTPPGTIPDIGPGGFQGSTVQEEGGQPAHGIAWAPPPVLAYPALRRKYGVLVTEPEASGMNGRLYLEAFLRKLEGLLEKETEASRAILLDRHFAAAHLAGGNPHVVAQAMWRELEEVRGPAERVSRWLDHPDEACLEEMLGPFAGGDRAASPVELSAWQRELEDLTLDAFLDLL